MSAIRDLDLEIYGEPSPELARTLRDFGARLLAPLATTQAPALTLKRKAPAEESGRGPR
ncbi:MAG: hypothetical protein OEO23_16105 [Gemmatimonadota bacterium]|nr:hypothetical protein [Gemmatimonadota bacterium]